MRAALIAVILLTSNALADTTNRSSDFFENREEGWFWYEVDPDPIEPIKPKPKVITTPPPSKPKPVLAKKPSPEPGSSAWIRENVQKYLDAALDDPSPENVQAFLYLQRMTMDKANAFSDMSSLMVQGNPDLDETYRRPLNSRGVQNMDAQSANNRDLLTKKLAKDKGLLFFFRSDCPYCHAIAPVMAIMRDYMGVTVRAVSLDGKGLPGKHFEEYKINSGQAEKLNVTTVPAVYMADLSQDGQNQIVPIGQGVMAMPEIKERMIIAAVKKGWLSEKEYDTSRPIYNADNSFAHVMRSPAFKDLQSDAQSEGNDTGYVDPQKLLEAMKGIK